MNAKTEFLDLTNKDQFIGAKIEIYLHDNKYNIIDEIIAILEPGFSEEEYEKFLKRIDVEYDSGFGGQELHGIVYCKNGLWFDRGEYDGSEWWERHQYPDLENTFKKEVVLRYKRLNKLNNILD